ncbi:hypothetical protein [Saccharothrix xinjiangensis]|uniref:Uncharacterized protein n=1 Tax=Saccharothrix xinjiangensis TaxID=204798 RepID=A0ABV9Y3X9_9PSEU
MVPNEPGAGRSTAPGHDHFAGSPGFAFFTDAPTGWATTVNGQPIGGRELRVPADSALSDDELREPAELRRP